MSDVRCAPVVPRLVAAVLLLVAAFGAAPARAAADAPAIAAPPDVVVGEADGFVDLTVRLSATAGSAVSVHYTTSNSTATASSGCNFDYAGTSGTLTFAPGETAKVVSVQILHCPTVRGFRSFTLDLSTPVNATIARASARVSIVDSSTVVATPRVYVRDATVDEQDGVALVGVLLGGPDGQSSNSTVTVDYATHDDTATAGSDYTAKSGTLSFAPGQTVKTIAVPITDDGDAEPVERFTVDLSGPSGLTVADSTGTVVIGAGDAPVAAQPRVSAPPDFVLGEIDGYVDLPVRLSAPSSSTVTVAYTTANSSATASTGCNFDYVGAAGTLTFAPGETTKTVRVEILHCPTVRNFRSFTLSLSTPVNATIARASARVSIVDGSTAAETPMVFVRDATVDERDGFALVGVLLGGPSGQASNSTITVHYETQDGTATAADHTALSGTLSFAPGQTVKTIAVPIADDAGSEPAERFELRVSDPVNATVADGTGTVVIGASDTSPAAQPRISAPPDMVLGEADGYVDLPVRLSAPSASTVSVAYTTANSTATASTGCNFDYVGTSGTVTFAPGETTKTVRVEILGCPTVRAFRSFTLGLGTPVNATIGRASARVSIVDASTVAETPTLFVRNATVDEKDGLALVSVLLGGPDGQSSNSTVTVGYATQDGSATAGNDYAAAGGTLSFAPGQTVKTIAVPITDDAGNEPAESFTLSLSGPVNATIAGGTGTVVIGASDAPTAATPGISAPPDTVVGSADGYVDLVVRLSAPATAPVSVAYATQNITAVASTGCNFDYVGAAGTLSFAPGETTKVVRVEILHCNVPAGFETFALTLSGATNATIPRATTHIAISQGGLTLSSIAVTPANPSIAAGTDKQLTATGTFSDFSTRDLTASVTWSSSGPGVASVDEAGIVHGVSAGTATISASLAAGSGSTLVTVSPPDGQRSQTITFAPLTDRTYGDPDFLVSASASSGLPVGFSASAGGCTLAGARVHIAAAGACTITASQPGDASTSAAPSVSRTFTIARAPQTISFAELANRTAGDPDFRLGAAASSGLAVGFSASGSCTVSGATVHLTGPGSCTVTAAQGGDANRAAAAPVSRTFTIAKQAEAKTCKVPDVVGKTLAAAKRALTRANCRVGAVTRAFSGKRRKGTVVAQSRRPKKVVPAGTKVGLVGEPRAEAVITNVQVER